MTLKRDCPRWLHLPAERVNRIRKKYISLLWRDTPVSAIYLHVGFTRSSSKPSLSKRASDHLFGDLPLNEWISFPTFAEETKKSIGEAWWKNYRRVDTVLQLWRLVPECGNSALLTMSFSSPKMVFSPLHCAAGYFCKSSNDFFPLHRLFETYRTIFPRNFIEPWTLELNDQKIHEILTLCRSVQSWGKWRERIVQRVSRNTFVFKIMVDSITNKRTGIWIFTIFNPSLFTG